MAIIECAPNSFSSEYVQLKRCRKHEYTICYMEHKEWSEQAYNYQFPKNNSFHKTNYIIT
jgi:hypothetical protein